MNLDYKNINIGKLIKSRVDELQLPELRICTYFGCEEAKIHEYYNSTSIDTNILLKWCKLLEYDFFRIYTQHIILYAPLLKNLENTNLSSSKLPNFRKNIYTDEIKDFILSLVNEKKLSCKQITDMYGIPKTTIHRWINKQFSDQ
ncbi:transposase [Apibacter sp. HY039]|uniref:transposase n=1 Tax=Apibacter sp. HY039 TaxID=2501476 RepID=UPI000FEB6E95|nr:transposase [Apibacter sp. HY039]